MTAPDAKLTLTDWLRLGLFLAVMAAVVGLFVFALLDGTGY